MTPVAARPTLTARFIIAGITLILAGINVILSRLNEDSAFVSAVALASATLLIFSTVAQLIAIARIMHLQKKRP